MTPPADLPSAGQAAAPRHAGVPFAADAAGHVVSPYTAPRGAPYHCLICQETVTLRRGLVRAPHFAHLAASQCRASGESIEHAAFKRLLATGLRTHRAFTAQVKCPACAHVQTTTFPLTPDSEVVEELTIDGFRADVGVRRAGQAVLAFEVYVTHAVGSVKALSLPVPWLEVSAGAAGVLDPHTRPTVRVRDTNLFRHRPCRACGSTASSQAEVEHQRLLAQETAWREAAAQRELARRAVTPSPRSPATSRPTPRRPETWVTPVTPAFVAYRTPLFITVQGVQLLLHTSVMGEVTISQPPQGQYVFRRHTLWFVPPNGSGAPTSVLIGPLIEQLLRGTLPVTAQGAQLLTQVRSVLAATSTS